MTGAADQVPLVTLEGRYIVVRGRLWLRAHPVLEGAERERLVAALMPGRWAIREALAGRGDLPAARIQVDAAKVALGERGPVWWTDGAPDLNRHMAANTPYATWFAEHGSQ